ncbi:hypothetical protein LX32DRAFT_327152 [Colletotrichum zoysiae]|uniref:Uncharacterized protein n=1 Tax=Colletotrichum zoysiae TaxID=1216348 RepID=A0AAD9H167_9PEZI|nr:hypothetical protein LX32DRAFT_327152 [Colletotrichum zoysiae]
MNLGRPLFSLNTSASFASSVPTQGINNRHCLAPDWIALSLSSYRHLPAERSRYLGTYLLCYAGTYCLNCHLFFPTYISRTGCNHKPTATLLGIFVLITFTCYFHTIFI